jgi:hypothetical protein
MEAMVNNPRVKQTNPNLAFVALLLVIMLGIFVYQTWVENGVFYQSDKPLITQEKLKEQYGLQVKLIRVMADGEFIDFRLKVVDPEKAGLLLKDPKIKPGIWIEETGSHLMISGVSNHDFELEEGKIIFISLPNSGGVVEPGTPVNVVFGNIFVEPIAAQ